MDQHFKITVAFGGERVTPESMEKVAAVASAILPVYRLDTVEAIRDAKSDYDAGLDTEAAEDFRRAEIAINNAIASQRLGGQIDLVLEPA